MNRKLTVPLSALLATLACTPDAMTDAGALADGGDVLADAGDGTDHQGDAGAPAPGPVAALSPSGCAFGDVEVGTAAFCDLTLENTGDEDLVVSATSFSVDTPLATDDNGDFDTSLPGFGRQTFVFLPTFIGPGTNTTFRLFVNPVAPGAMSGQWRVETNDAQRPTLEVALTATGVAP